MNEQGVAMAQHKFKADLLERHEVTIKGTDKTITFSVDSKDGRLVIRQEAEGKKPKDVCSITLADPEELGRFLEGLRRIVASLEIGKDIVEPAPAGANLQRTNERRIGTEEREALIEKARARNPQAFAPWSKVEEQQVRKEYEEGLSVTQIAKEHKRSPRAIELRLQRLGVIPPD
jgi:DNA-binding NarL/FixJ family response regulator